MPLCLRAGWESVPQVSSQGAKNNVRATGGREYRTPISEVKNLNSFRAVREAIRYEIDRQVKAWQADHDYTLENKGKMNFGWNADRGVTEFQRGKEESHDYRYFPDPDLVPVTTDAALLDSLAERVGELPLERQRRFIADYQMSEKECETVLADGQTSMLFEEAVADAADAKTLTKHFMGAWSHVASAAGTTIGRLGVSAKAIAELVKLVTDGVVSASAASQIAERLYQTRQEKPPSPMDAARELGLIQERDESALAAWVDEAFAKNPQAVQDAIGSNPRKAKAAPGFLRGQVMRISQGKADPKLTGKMIEEKLAQAKAKPDAS